MTDRDLDQLERDARRPNYGGKYYPPAIVLALIDALKEARRESQTRHGELFAESESIDTAKESK